MELLDRLQLKSDTFAGRVAVVTGAARGIGEQVARGLAHLGAHVIILDILEEGEGVAAQIRGNSRCADFARVDLRDIDALNQFQHETLAAHGAVDILVNNAAKVEYRHFRDAPLDLWDDLHFTTVRASTFLSQKFLPKMLETRFGVICNTVAVDVWSISAHFAAAMASQKSMVLSLAGELGNNSGVSAFGFAPGVVDTPLVRNLAARHVHFKGIPQEEYIDRFIHNPGYDGPGYEGLMPAEHCGASYVYCIANARAYQGQIADAFHPLINHGIITPRETKPAPVEVPEGVDKSLSQVSDYVLGFAQSNRNLETRIVERTKELEAANLNLAQQKQLFEEFSNKISRYLPKQIYESIFAGEIDAKIESRRRNLTIFFSDLCDFSGKTERLEPEALSEILNRYFSEMTTIARAHGATIDKFIGDAILIFFGDPSSQGQEADAMACVSMAIEMQRRMAGLRDQFVALGLNEPLEMRIGINSGYCTVGNFGSFERIDYTIVGTPVNVAARLQDAGEPGAILVSKNTHALVGRRFEFQPLGPMRLKGIVEEVDTYRVRFEIDKAPVVETTPDEALDALRKKLGEVDLDTLKETERDELLKSVAKLLDR
jgi:class 3 adenylate cyclase/NAD(P)-dependent dehydrogenase (short-subunit alcohol dehydrogenase family)